LRLKALAGDSTSEDALFSALIVRFSTIAKRRVQKSHVEDVVHDASAVVAAKYRDLDNSVNFDAWAYKVLRNVIANHLRAQMVRKDTVIDTDLVERSPQSDFDDSAAALRIDLKTCLSKLVQARPRYAKVLHMSLSGYTTEQICDELNLSRTNVYVTLCRGREWLRECLSRRTEYES